MKRILRSLRLIIDGTDRDKPAGWRLLIDFGHVAVGPLLVAYPGGWLVPALAALWALWFGIVKQVHDWPSGWRDALRDDAIILATTSSAAYAPPAATFALMSVILLYFAWERGVGRP